MQRFCNIEIVLIQKIALPTQKEKTSLGGERLLHASVYHLKGTIATHPAVPKYLKSKEGNTVKKGYESSVSTTFSHRTLIKTSVARCSLLRYLSERGIIDIFQLQIDFGTKTRRKLLHEKNFFQGQIFFFCRDVETQRI